MPHRVVALAHEVSHLTTERVRSIEAVADRTRMLGLNARIQAAHAGDHGRAFSVVADDIRAVADQVRGLSAELTTALGSRLADLDRLGRQLGEEVPGQRAADLALNAVELIDRNLYERSCDVRWWATDASLVAACAATGDAARTTHACSRLGVILDAYTVYLDLWLADADGRVIAHGRSDRYAGVVGTSVAGDTWFRQAMATTDGDGYAVDDVAVAPGLGGACTATYATAVREGGERTGRPVGALGIFFDWEPQAAGILRGLRLSDEERARTRALLLDADGRVLAASDGTGVLTERIALQTEGKRSGYYREGETLVGFARTPGYETYEGLGWYGALVQRPRATGP